MDPEKIQTHKRFKRTPFIMTKRNMRICDPEKNKRE